MKFFSPLLGATLRLFIRELRDTRQTLRDGIDTYRQVHGLATLYSDPLVDESEPAAGGIPPNMPTPIVGSGDYLTIDILGELAMEYGIRVTPELDLEGLARDRGWVDADGKLLMLPRSYDGLELGDLSIIAPGFKG